MFGVCFLAGRMKIFGSFARSVRCLVPNNFFHNAVFTWHEQVSEKSGEGGGDHTWGPCLYVFSRVLPLSSKYIPVSPLPYGFFPSPTRLPKQTMQTRPWVSCKSSCSSRPCMVTQRPFPLAPSSTASGTPASSSLHCMQTSVSCSLVVC